MDDHVLFLREFVNSKRYKEKIIRVLFLCEFVNSKRYKEKIIREIITDICAVLNSNGGKVNIYIDTDSSGIPIGGFPFPQISLVIRILEQSLISIIGVRQTISKIKFKERAERIVVSVAKADSLITINYNLYLPSETRRVVQVSPLEPLENVKHNIMNRKVIPEPVQLGSHCKIFRAGKDCGFHENKSVQLKLLKAGSSKRTTLADRMTGKGTEFSCYVSAFANYNGGHIYYGIRDDGVVEGELIPYEDIFEIRNKVEKAIKKMIWREQIWQPKQGVEWDIFFEPVVDENSKPIPSTFVIVIYIAPFLGGVFTEEPECYGMVKWGWGEIEKMSFVTWKNRWVYFARFAESRESWKWEESSIIHREKFITLHEYGQEHPEEIKNINGVRVCCSKEFLIGRGSDATRVYIGLGTDGYERAVKRLPRDDCDFLAEQEKKVLNELNTTESSYVVKYRFFDDKSDKDWLYLIMDLCEETLKEFVERSSLDDLATNAQTIIRQVLTGLADLHRDPKPVLHRDLKPSNILRNVNDKWLLADFGISLILTEDVSTFRSKERGTKHWRAVESCCTNDMSGDDDVRYKKKSDIQVAGMVAFYIVTKGQHPFGEERFRLGNLLDGKPVGLDTLKDPVLKDLLSWMLSHDPKGRPSAQEALKHPYFQLAKQQFEMLCKVGKQKEIKTGDVKSDVVRQLNSDPKNWRSLMNADVLKYLSTNPLNGYTFHYRPSWTDCLRLIRNIKEHWHDRPMPQPKAFYLVGDPQEYFLNLFPNLPVEVHKIIRSCDWKERPGLQEYFS